jgi:hypothetical protein
MAKSESSPTSVDFPVTPERKSPMDSPQPKMKTISRGKTPSIPVIGSGHPLSSSSPKLRSQTLPEFVNDDLRDQSKNKLM